MLVKSTKAEFKVIADQRIIEGYASVFGNVDEVGDIVVVGAYAKTITERVPTRKVKSCRDHRLPIGMPLTIEEDSTGLFTRTKISATPLGDETLVLVGDGVYNAMSVAYDTIKSDYGTIGDRSVRYLRELKLYEYGPVLFPANELAAITAVKSEDSLGKWLGDLHAYFESIKDNPAARDAAVRLLGDRLPELQKHIATLALPNVEPAPKATPAAPEPQTPPDDPQQALQSLLDSLSGITAA